MTKRNAFKGQKRIVIRDCLGSVKTPYFETPSPAEIRLDGPNGNFCSYACATPFTREHLAAREHLAGKKIRQYEYFDYKANEALHVSEAEQQVLVGLLHQIGQEYRAPLDILSPAVMLAQIELLLTYADRFYQRQFRTRPATHHQLLSRLEDLLQVYFTSDKLPVEGTHPSRTWPKRCICPLTT